MYILVVQVGKVRRGKRRGGGGGVCDRGERLSSSSDQNPQKKAGYGTNRVKISINPKNSTKLKNFNTFKYFFCLAMFGICFLKYRAQI